MSKLLASPNGQTGLPHDLIPASDTGQNAIFCTSGNVEGPPSKPTAGSQPNTGPKVGSELKRHEPPPPPTAPPPKPPKGKKAETVFGYESAHILESEPHDGPGRAPKPIPPPPHPDPVRPPPPPPAHGEPTLSELNGRGYSTLGAVHEVLIPADGGAALVEAGPLSALDVGSDGPGGHFNPLAEPPAGPLMPPQPKTPPPPSAPKCLGGHKPPPFPITPPPKPPKSEVCTSQNTPSHLTSAYNSRKAILPGAGEVQTPGFGPGSGPGRAPKPAPPVPYDISFVGPKEASPKNPLAPPRPNTPPPPAPKNREGHKPPPPPPTPPPKPPKSSKANTDKDVQGVTLFKAALKFGPNGAAKPLLLYPDPVRPPPRPHEPLGQPGSLRSYANEWYGCSGRTTFGEGILGASLVAVVG
ncbi:hypothetical protein FRC06_002388 [Ceratobasidium sp. 370]|nr:hypothetical protein FRC06_002388 [Ceratobasidium sp. 370]